MSVRTGRVSPFARAVVILAALGGCSPESGEGPEPLQRITVPELSDSFDARTVVVDVRERAQFEAGHIEGALWLEPGTLRATIDGVEGQVAPRPDAESVFAEAALFPEAMVVVTGEANDTSPARVAWTLQYYGHQGPVALLDGGMRAWTAAGQPVETELPASGEEEYGGEPTRESLRVDRAWVLDHLDDPQVVLFDVRTPDEYAEGHIPGAINVDWTTNLGPDGAFRPASDVRQLHGDPAESTLVVYCRTGSRAAVSWALLDAAGYDDVRLYDGSWADWSRDPDTPRE